MMEWVELIGRWAGYAAIGLLCAGGVGLSLVSLSGTWLVGAAALVAAMLNGWVDPGWGVVLVFFGIAGAIELAEFVAGVYGVQRRGGSRWAGLAALGGGIAGGLLGILVPVWLVGSLVGMFAGSFLAVFAVEYRRTRHRGQAVHVARGAVVARVAVLLLKIGATAGMCVYLAWVMVARH